MEKGRPGKHGYSNNIEDSGEREINGGDERVGMISCLANLVASGR